MLLDESLSSLDDEMSLEVWKNLIDYCKRKHMILISITYNEFCDEIVDVK